MEDDFQVDLERVIDSIKEAEVISILFAMLRKSLVIDLRPNDEDPPIIRIAPQSRARRTGCATSGVSGPACPGQPT